MGIFELDYSLAMIRTEVAFIGLNFLTFGASLERLGLGELMIFYLIDYCNMDVSARDSFLYASRKQSEKEFYSV